jgi:two-component SAPR family response regulator
MMEKLECIVLIDDDALTNYLHSEIINDLGIVKEIRTFTSNKEAITFFKGINKNVQKPELIFVDINMDGESGFDFLAEFQKEDDYYRKEVRIIMLSSSTLKDDKKLADSFGVEYMVKPLTDDKLFSLIHSMELDG